MRTAKTLIRLADAQADLSLRWAHMPFCWFCHEAAQMLNRLPEKLLTVCFRHKIEFSKTPEIFIFG